MNEEIANYTWQGDSLGNWHGYDTFYATFKGNFAWHKHDNISHLLLIIKGSVLVKFRDREVTLNQGDSFVIPKGVDHLPIAAEEAELLFIKTDQPLNTKQ